MAAGDPPTVTWSQVLAWRMRRQQLDPPGDGSAIEIARRLGGLQAQVASAAELAVAVRQAEPTMDGAVGRALWDERTLVKTWAMRGTLHALPADLAGDYLVMSGTHRWWEKPSWQKTFGATPDDLEAIAAAASDALDGGDALTREQLTDEVVERTGSEHLREVLGSGWGTLLKPLAWWGVLCHGPSQANRITFASPERWVPGWRGLPELDAAAPVVLRAYLGAHGPATPETFDAWLSRGATRRALRRSWFESMEDELAPVAVEDAPMWVLASDLDELLATDLSGVVRLVGGFDQYVLGAGTNATYLVPSEHRGDVSRTGGWISPVVLYEGRVVGVWRPDDGIDVTLWEDVPKAKLKRETARLRSILDSGG
jgi:Winged helix DNA-binding domain